MIIGPWLLAKDGDPILFQIYRRHYSCLNKNPKIKQFVGPGEKMVLTTPDYSALWVWRKFIDHAEPKQQGVNCAVFRKEGNGLSSDLILAAEEWAWDRWSGERLYTYINGKKIMSTNPGYCFLMAGWKKCGNTKGGLTILEKVAPCQSRAATGR